MPSIDMNTDDGKREALRRMVTIREFDTAAGDRFADGEIPGFVHLYVGEEAVGVGAAAALESDDYVSSTHRGHGHCIAKGLDPKYMMAELFGKAEGYCNGKGGSMHIADVDAGMLGANGIVGAGPPLASGAALAAALDGRDQVALAFCGDGGVAQGQVHEAVNLASTWDLPAIILIENNQFGEYTPLDQQHNIDTLANTASAYDIPGVTVDGMDVTAIYEAVSEARDRAIEGKGPTFLEAETYRYRGHVEGDEQHYRTEDEIDEWRENRDCIETFKNRLVDRDVITEGEFETMQREVATEIEEAVAFAREAANPDPSEAYEDMFSDAVPDIEYHRGRLRTDGGSSGGDRP